MTKFILLALILSLPSFAQDEDDLTLESTTAPTVMEDGTDLSQAPMEEPVAEAASTPESVQTVDPMKDIPPQLPDTSPMELTNKSVEEKTVTETPDDGLPENPDLDEDPSKLAETPEEVPTPNPTVADEVKTTPEPEPEKVVDQTPPPSVTTPVITSEAKQDSRFINHRKSHWLTTFTFENMKYTKLPWDFEGTRRNVRQRDQDLFGGRLGVGGQLYIGAGLFTTSKIEGYYLGTLTRKAQIASPDVVNVEAGSIKRTGGVYGIDVAQQLGFMFEYQTKNPFFDQMTYLTFEPFVEVGAGIAKAYHAVNYQYDTTGGNPGGVKEFYKAQLRDDLTNARVGAGFNMTSRAGYFLQVKASVNRFDITNRKLDSKRLDNGGTITQDTPFRSKDAKIDPVTIISIGGGYKF